MNRQTILAIGAHFDDLAHYEGLGQVRGAQVGVSWAEAFAVPPWAQRRGVASLSE